MNYYEYDYAVDCEPTEDYNAYEEQQIFEDHEDRADSKWEYSLLEYDEPDSEDDDPF